MEDRNDVTPTVGKFFSAVGYAIGIAFFLNVFISLELFFAIVLPDFGKGTFWHNVLFAIIMAIFFSVRETFAKNKNLKLFMGFNFFILVVNVYAIYKNWFVH